MRSRPFLELWMLAMAVLAPVFVSAQTITPAVGDLSSPVAKSKSYVLYDAEQQSVLAGKRGVLELRFRVVDGFHVNSHHPKSELLIPTEIALDSSDGVKITTVEYPAGTTYILSADPSTKLDVYTGEFTLRVPVTATAGEHTIQGTLRYQACDRAACYPPKSLPVQVLFTAK